MENTETRKENKKTKLLILLLLLLTLIAVGVTVWALFFRDTGPVLTPDYAPRQEEQHAQDIGDDDVEKLEAPQGGGAVGLTYSTEVTIDLSEENATLMFQNPSRSTSDMVVQIVIQDEIVAQSGKLVPGKEITTLDLLSGAAKKLAPGGYDAKFVVLMYDPDTGEKAMLNSEAAISVTVVE